MGSKMILYFTARKTSQPLPVDGNGEIKSTFSASEYTVIFIVPAVLFLRSLQQQEPEVYQWKAQLALWLSLSERSLDSNMLLSDSRSI